MSTSLRRTVGVAALAAAWLGANSATAEIVRCESIRGMRQECATPLPYGVYMARQLGGSGCTQGKSWGSDAAGVWVDNNCRAEFRTEHDPQVADTRVDCDSDHGQVERCPADTRAGALIVEDDSNDHCVLGQSWGWESGTVWVSHRCHASFSLAAVELGRAVRCAAPGNQRVLCAVDTSGGVTLEVEHSTTSCAYGESWGLDPGGVWVAPGCDATFRADGRLRGSQTWSQPPTLACEAFGAGRVFCPVDTSSGVALETETSQGVCVERGSWGTDAHGLWVGGGCRALFRLGR